METTPAIKTTGLSIGYVLKRGRKRLIHSGLDLELAHGELTALLGRNGAGKSTLLKTLCGLLRTLEGDVLVAGRKIGDYSAQELSSQIGVVLTEKTQTGGITVYELVSLGRYPYTGFFGTLREEDHQAVRTAIAAVGIVEKQESYLDELSDGERQKAFIAKALAQECPIIILDEPTAFLDVTSRFDTMTMLKELAREQNKAILLSTHDLEMALRLSDRLWLLNSTSTDPSLPQLLCGTPDQFSADGTLGRFFGDAYIPSAESITR